LSGFDSFEGWLGARRKSGDVRFLPLFLHLGKMNRSGMTIAQVFVPVSIWPVDLKQTVWEGTKNEDD
jgi:hypothetical protein